MKYSTNCIGVVAFFLICSAVQAIPNRSEWRGETEALLQSSKDVLGRDFVESKKGSGVIFVKPGCPMAGKYLPKLNEMALGFKSRGVALIIVSQSSSEETTLAWAKKNTINFKIIHDEGKKWLLHFEAQISPEAFVVDSSYELVYRGMIDDHFAPGGVIKSAPDKTPFLDTLEKVSREEYVRPFLTRAQGCYLSTSKVSFKQDVAPLIYERCAICHRPGDIKADIPLTRPEEIADWGLTISERLKDGIMPPWLADHRLGSFSNDLGLSLNEIWKINQWVGQGSSIDEGLTLKEVKPELSDSEWRLPRLDAVLPMLPEGEGYAVPEEGRLPYQHFIVESPFEADKWVTATEVKPGASDVVHHINVFLITPPEEDGERMISKVLKRRLALKRLQDRGQAVTPESVAMVLDLYGYKLEKRVRFLSDYNPAESRTIFGDGKGYLLKKGAKFVFEVHYTPNGVAQTDNSRIAFQFADTVPDDWRVREPITRIAGHMGRIKLPPNDTLSLDYDLPFFLDADLQSLKPHMHYRGRSFAAKLILPDGKEKQLLSLPSWNYDFQMPYIFEKPIFIPQGSILRMSYRWDNTASNPNLSESERNSSVRFGFQTEDEMSMAFPTYSYRSQSWNEILDAESRVTGYLEGYVDLPARE